jgi:hypothetical protein
MKFGIGVSAHIKNWEFIQYAESLGFDRAWVGDSQMIWSDCYAVLALAAHHTSRIELGTGVAITGTRIAPVTAHCRNRAGPHVPGAGHRPYRDARDGPEPDARESVS